MKKIIGIKSGENWIFDVPTDGNYSIWHTFGLQSSLTTRVANEHFLKKGVFSTMLFASTVKAWLEKVELEE